MKRRNFIGMLGAIVAAPLLPAMGAAGTAPVSRAAYGLAVNHARTRPHVTARGLAFCLKMSKEQAAALMSELSARGVVTPVSAAVDGTARATSNILIKDPWGLARVRQPARAVGQDTPKRDTNRGRTGQGAEARDWIAHVRQICRDRGMTPSPRCFA